jgi:hypothetical protein
MLALLTFFAAAAAPPPAKSGPVEKLHEVVVDAIRNCPRSTDGEIVICARDRGIAEGYRIPKLDPRFAGARLRPSGRGTIDGADVGKSGIGSCTKVGAGGSTGCALRDLNQWSDWRRQQRRAAEDGN